MWNDRMLAESDCTHVGQARFFQAQMTRCATVGNLLFGNPDLLDAALEVTFHGNGISTPTNEMQVLVLVMTPLAEVVFRRRNGQQRKQDDARGAEGASAVTEEEPPQRFEGVLHQ